MKKTLGRILAVTLALAATCTLFGCKKTDSLTGDGRERSAKYAEVFAPLLSKVSWGMTIDEVQEVYTTVSSETVYTDQITCTPLYTLEIVCGQNVSLWLKFDDAHGLGLYEITCTFDEEDVTAVQKYLEDALGAYKKDREDGDKFTLYSSKAIGEYYTEEDIRATYSDYLGEDGEENLDKNVEEALTAPEYSYKLFDTGYFCMNAARHLIFDEYAPGKEEETTAEDTTAEETTAEDTTAAE